MWKDGKKMSKIIKFSLIIIIVNILVLYISKNINAFSISAAITSIITAIVITRFPKLIDYNKKNNHIFTFVSLIIIGCLLLMITFLF